MPANASTIDLRSDTVTVPTPAMLEAMAAAEVGDDVYGEDPSANRLEAMVAERLGKEGALFVPSGTMANLIALCVHARPGDELVCDAGSHCYHYEGGGYAAFAGLSVRLLEGERGILRPGQVQAAIRPADQHLARTRLVVIENTHNRGGGAVYPVGTVEAIGRLCREHGLRLHVDGARLWNACVAAGVEPRDYARHVDSVAVCLSKGLGCPVGSALAGGAEFIAEARRVRKRLGGGMRQAGYLAAAGIYALQHHLERLAEDHAHARLIADVVRACGRLRLKYDPPETNMVYVETVPPLAAEQFVATMRGEGILTGLRAVTHLGVTREDVERVAGALREHFG